MILDLSASARKGVLALLAATIAAGAMFWWSMRDGSATAVRLQAAQEAARRIAGREPLSGRVERQQTANTELRANIATLKQQAGFTVAPRFQVPPDHKEPGKYFLNQFVTVRQALREKALARRIDSDERLGFPPDDKVPSDAEAPQLLAMLQLTEKALTVVLDAPDPVEWFDITHAKPYETGPANRPPLLLEYPLTLKVRGSLKTVLWILHRFGQREDKPGEYPLILRGLTIRSENTRAKDDIQQLEATYELAGMSFIDDLKREAAAGAPRSEPASRLSGMRARP